MEIFVTLILILIGLILITLEVLLLPGLIVGIFGGLLIVSAIVYATVTLGFYAGIYTIILSILSSIFLFVLFKKLKVWDRFILKDEHNVSKSKNENLITNDLVDKNGIALTDLRPSGFILVDNKKLDAQSSGEFIPKNSKVEIVSIESFKITVKKVED